ncbi:MAG TPA: nucleotide exchange factor GrpE [Candidatus Nanoarchaeia archaeon]|nr:nucleotide exchange factor GrpE [Candidatus Nanoarchaeia archaeon]
MVEGKIVEDPAKVEIADAVMNVKEVPLVDNNKFVSLEKLQRLQAEFDNYRKRLEKEKQELVISANAGLMYELLSVLDNFELSLKHNNDKGIMLVYQELQKILEKKGLKVIEAKGVFNPKIHEAVMKVEGEQDGIILEELQRGYWLHDKLLRASKVKVSRVTDKK